MLTVCTLDFGGDPRGVTMRGVRRLCMHQIGWPVQGSDREGERVVLQSNAYKEIFLSCTLGVESAHLTTTA